MAADDGDDRVEADAYRHPDGTTEVVFALEEGRVLTVREYPDAERFESAVDGATYQGRHEGVASLIESTDLTELGPEDA